jgi:hypothetical protein
MMENDGMGHEAIRARRLKDENVSGAVRSDL